MQSFRLPRLASAKPAAVSYTHLDVYKRQAKVQVAAQAEPKAVAFQPKTVQLGPSPSSTQAPAPKKPKRNVKGILAGIFVLLAVIAVAGYFLLNRGSSDTINLEDYVKLEIEGTCLLYTSRCV